MRFDENEPQSVREERFTAERARRGESRRTARLDSGGAHIGAAVVAALLALLGWNHQTVALCILGGIFLLWFSAALAWATPTRTTAGTPSSAPTTSPSDGATDSEPGRGAGAQVGGRSGPPRSTRLVSPCTGAVAASRPIGSVVNRPSPRSSEQAEPTGFEPASSRFWRPRATTSALRPAHQRLYDTRRRTDPAGRGRTRRVCSRIRPGSRTPVPFLALLQAEAEGHRPRSGGSGQGCRCTAVPGHGVPTSPVRPVSWLT